MAEASKAQKRTEQDILEGFKSYKCQDWVNTSAEKRYDIYKLLCNMYKQKKGYDVKKTAELFKPPRRHATSTLEHICNLKSMKNKEPKTEG